MAFSSEVSQPHYPQIFVINAVNLIHGQKGKSKLQETLRMNLMNFLLKTVKN